MADTAWKAAERAHAADLGVRRIPVTGVDRHGADFTDATCAYQHKLRRALPSWMFRWLAGIVTTAGASGRIGVLVLNKPRRPRAEALVVLRWSDWLRVRPDAAHSTEESHDD